MKTKKIILLIALASASLLGLTGCFDAHESSSKLPWARPAEWEGQAPGMGF